PINLYKFHKPRLHLYEVRSNAPKQETKRCIRNLANYHPPKVRMKFPRSRCAAVLVALFVGRLGDLYVLLCSRSTSLRTYAGDTSLPGGKVDPEDRTIEDTARREAFEEIGLTRDKKKVPLLCILEPYLSGNELIVTPVVVLILDNSLDPILNRAEVSSLFSHPLASFLSSEAPFPSEPESVEVAYHTYKDIRYRGDEGRKIRIHSFLTGREAGGIKPVFGLTASILIDVAIAGYSRQPTYELRPPNSPTMEERIAYSMLLHPTFRKAFVDEGMN
ncbi:hypothetical protein PILCRDRAFT_24230, partial [Piloderma croceum F 1598]